MPILFKHSKLFLKCKLPLFDLIDLKGINFTPYYLPLIWIEWNITILFIKANKQKLWKLYGRSSLIYIYSNKIVFYPTMLQVSESITLLLP